MFVHYYDLRNPARIPSTSYFSDPIDGAKCHPQKNETLQDFISRIVTSREEKGLLPISKDSFDVLVITSLSETTSSKEHDQYFVRKSMTPAITQVISLAKTIISQCIHHKHTPYNIRQERANSCMGCKLHASRSSFAWAVNKIITAAASLESIKQSDVEKKLGQCRACGCDLQAKVCIDIEAVVPTLGPSDIGNILEVYREQSFSHCWMLREAFRNSSTKQLLINKTHHLGTPYNTMAKAYEAQEIQKAKRKAK
jgi:hypothetical protein